MNDEASELRELLSEERDYSYRLGLALMELGHHNNGLHQSPQSYDAESGMACPITQCLMTFVKWRLSAAHGTPHEMAYEAPRTAQDAR